LVGKSAAIAEVRERIEQARDARVVLIRGETGTGKDLVARALHRARAEPQAPFVVVNCAAFPEQLIESELFGHVRGAYSGAMASRRGLLSQAEGGTVFLDEVGEIPVALQPRMLRFVENGEVRALGADHTTRVDCTIVAATNRDLEDEVARGDFRQDLFYRLDAFPISIPPLRNRPEDIEALALHFLPLIARALKRPVPHLSSEVLDAAARYDWPGNVRQLKHALQRAAMLSRGDEIAVEQLVPARAGATRSEAAPAVDEPILPLAEVERRHILAIMQRVGDDRARAAELLGISRSTLRRKLIEYGVSGGN
jgi:transcriptional regulator with PAS, ATPase and Fis domain